MPLGGREARAPRVTVLTMVRDEARMLPWWIGHYGRQVGTSNLLVLDDNSTDGSTDGLPCPVYRLPPPPWTRRWSKARLQLVNGMARGLLACNDVVIYTDVDELVVADPAKYDGLVDYFATPPRTPVVAPLALEVLHHQRQEPDLDPSRTLLSQRQFVKYSPGMCKPVVKRVPRDWSNAFHRINREFTVDRDLWMFHLKYADAATMATVAEHRRRVHEEENRGHRDSFWPLGPERLTQKLAGWTQEADGSSVIPEFDSAAVELEGLIVGFEDGSWGSSVRQVDGLEGNPLRRVPGRFRDVF